MCIEREQPSTALRPMPHFTTYGGSHFSAGPDVYHPEFQPELNDFESPHGTYFAGRDPLTGNDIWSPAPECTYTSEPGGNDPIVHHVGTTSGPGGTSFFKEDFHGTIGYEMEAGTDLRSDNRFVFEPMDVMPSLGESFDPGLDAAGGFQPHDVTAVQIGEPPEPELWLQTLG